MRTVIFSALLFVACTGDKDKDTGTTEALEENVHIGDAGQPLFRTPLSNDNLFNIRIGMDHDPEIHGSGVDSMNCTDYLGRGFPSCYDEHDGTDYVLVGGFDAMDSGSAEILSAAPGTVIDTVDGNYDRCHGDLQTMDVSCDGHPMVANSVSIRHESGHITHYWHMKKDSVAVEIGEQVSAGDVLGLVGSSGYSSMPHLHFELEASNGEIIDPYAGPHSQEESYWCEQEDPFPGLCD